MIHNITALHIYERLQATLTFTGMSFVYSVRVRRIAYTTTHNIEVNIMHGAYLTFPFSESNEAVCASNSCAVYAWHGVQLVSYT